VIVAEMLMGVETEYAISGLGGWDEGEQANLVNTLLEMARKKLVHLLDSGSGLYLENGGRFYIDHGNHPEFSTPECANPSDVIRYIVAGERILTNLIAQMKIEDSSLSDVLLFKSNVDYGDTGTTWGCHESYMHRAGPLGLSGEIVPHLVTRIIYTGAGGFNSLSDGLEFTLSPRVPHLSSVTSNNSTYERGIFHTKDEPLSKAGFHRLHIICGESNCSETSMWLKVATTALVVAMIDAGLCPGVDVALRSPLRAMQQIANDESCSATVELTSGRRMTALEIQYHYLSLAEKNLSNAKMPHWAPKVCGKWRSMLNRLLDAPDSVATTLDWAIKLALYTDYARSRGIAWNSIRHWTRILKELRREFDASDAYSQPFTADLILRRRSPVRDALKRLSPFLKEHGLRWDSLDTVLAVRSELFEIDTRYGQLDASGIFAKLDRKGVLTHHVPGIDAIEHAMTHPPDIGRARIRGEVIKRLASQNGLYSCDWKGIANLETRRVLDLSDPFETELRWLDVPQTNADYTCDLVSALTAAGDRGPSG